MANGDNPIINRLVIPDYYGADEIVNLHEINFRFAFTVEGFVKRVRKDDPRFVKWNVRFYGFRNGEPF